MPAPMTVDGVSTKALSRLVSKLDLDLGTTYLRIPPGTRPADLNTLVERIQPVGTAYWWWIGDLASFALHNFKRAEREAFLEHLREVGGVRRAWLQQVAHTSQAYAVEDRVAGLSITHHIRLRHVVRNRRQHLLRLAFKRRLPVRVIFQSILPRARRTVVVRLRLAAHYARTRRFQLDLQDFCRTWHVLAYGITGKQRPAAAYTRPKRPPKALSA